MKNFIYKIGYFLFPIISFIFLYFLLIIFSTNYIRNNSTFYSIDSEIETLFLGDSHISHAINDALVPSSKNLAKPAEPYYYSYHKLKFFTNTNSKINKIYLGFSYHSLSSSYDEFINGMFSSNIGPPYFFILPFKEQLRLLYWNRKSIMYFFKKLFNVLIDHINDEYKRNTSLYHGFDNFYPKSCINQDSISDRINFQYYVKNRSEILDPADLNYFYFNKIIKYCVQNDLNIKLISTPIHNKNYERIPLSYKKLLKNYKDSNFIDFTLLIKEDCKFSPDGDHVSIKGAEVTTLSFLKKFN